MNDGVLCKFVDGQWVPVADAADRQYTVTLTKTDLELITDLMLLAGDPGRYGFTEPTTYCYEDDHYYVVAPRWKNRIVTIADMLIGVPDEELNGFSTIGTFEPLVPYSRANK